ncbi:MAG: CarD family transcriptional regulator [Nitrososphaerales archaeon]
MMDSTELRLHEHLRAGEPVYHPKYGFGVVRGIRDQGMGHLVEPSASGETEAYYEIDITGEGTLFVPVGRAGMVGLRRLTNGLATIFACLASDGAALPADSRQRLAGLRQSEQAREPEALPEAVRDLLAVRRTGQLTSSERKWLDHACRRLSAEAAIVDHIAESEAHAAILAAVEAAAVPGPGSSAGAPTAS